MPLYENSVIYKLVHKNDQDNENIYIGSTTNFRGRKVEHKRSCCNEQRANHNFPIYKYIRENGGWEEWEMIAVETYPCENKRELEIRERFHIETFKSKLNKYIPTRTHKEYYEDNKDNIKKNKKQYHQDNREKILEYKKQYHQDNREKILEYQKQYHKKKMEELNK